MWFYLRNVKTIPKVKCTRDVYKWDDLLNGVESNSKHWWFVSTTSKSCASQNCLPLSYISPIVLPVYSALLQFSKMSLQNFKHIATLVLK